MNDDAASLRRFVVRLINSGAALGTAAVIAIAGILAWGYRTNSRLDDEITRLHGETQVLNTLQRENRRLARLVAEADELKRELVELPALRAAILPPAEPPLSGMVTLTFTPRGTIQWEGDDVMPAEFIRRLQTFHSQYPAPDSSVVVRASEVSLSAVAYLLDEIRKAKITRILVEGEPKPDGGAAAWF